MLRSSLGLALALVALGCSGDDAPASAAVPDGPDSAAPQGGGGGGGGGGGTGDGGPTPAGNPPLPDGAPGPTDAGHAGEGSTSPFDGGPLPQIACGTACAYGSMCDEATSQCACVPGFVAQGATCVRPAKTDPATRTKADVCAHWADGHRVTAAQAYIPGSGGACDPGRLPSDALADAMRRWNMYRWMVGLPPAAVDPAAAAAEQQCALLQSIAFGHTVDPTTQCYTAAGANAAGASMIAQGFGSAASTMDAYMFEPLSSRLAHRKISLGINRDNVNFGFSRDGSCALYAYGYADPVPPTYVPFPNAGITPIGATAGPWSLFGTLPIGKIAMRDKTHGVDMAVTQDAMYAGYNAWLPNGWTPKADTTYTVTLTDGTSTISYDVTPVTCP